MKKSNHSKRRNSLAIGLAILLALSAAAWAGDESFYGRTSPAPQNPAELPPPPPTPHGSINIDTDIAQPARQVEESLKGVAAPAPGPEAPPAVEPLPGPETKRSHDSAKKKDVAKSPQAPDAVDDQDYSVNELLEKIKSANRSNQVVYDEGFQPIEIALKDISRIVCFTDIARVVYSKEKVIQIKQEGKDAFVKILPVEVTDPATGKVSLKYDKRPKEAYIVCGSRTFSLLLVPRDIPATTVYLKSAAGEKDAAQKYEKNNDYDGMLFKLIKDVYKEDVPNGYEITDINRNVKKFSESDVVHKRNYTGDMFQVQEYIIYARKAINLDEISLLEILNIKNPLAISVVDNALEAKQQTRVIVVRLNNE